MHMSICDISLKHYIIAVFLQGPQQTRPQLKMEVWFTKYLVDALEVRLLCIFELFLYSSKTKPVDGLSMNDGVDCNGVVS